jgi:hypothetical protein
MKTYIVVVTRDTSESCFLKIKAETPEEAEGIALRPDTIRNYTPDDWAGRPYVSDSGEDDNA